MSTLWLTLALKEWHEHKWKLLSLIAIALSVFVVCLLETWDTVSAATSVTIVGIALLAPLFVGMTVCASEHSQRTIAFVAAQPVPLWKVATVRLLAGGVVVVIPILATLLLALVISPLAPQQYGADAMAFEGLPSPTDMMLMGGLMSLNLYAWIVAVAVNQRTELRAGLIGLVVTAVLIALGVWGTTVWNNRELGMSLAGLIAVVCGPMCGFLWADAALQSRPGWIATSMIAQTTTILGLSALMILRYGQPESLKKRLSTWRASLGALPRRPFGSPLRALLWMQCRESIPVCLAGTVLLGLIALIGSDTSRGLEPTFFVALSILFVVVGASLMLGTIGYVNDLEPGLYTFWRSRPISAAGWFWLRYAAGLLAIGVFILPPIAGLALMAADASVAWWYVLLLPLISLIVYSVGVLCACSVRHPVYSVILAVCAAMLVLALPEMLKFATPMSIGRMLQEVDRSLQAGAFNTALWYLLGAVTFAGTVSAAAAVTAAMLLKRDIYFRS